MCSGERREVASITTPTGHARVVAGNGDYLVECYSNNENAKSTYVDEPEALRAAIRWLTAP